MRLPERPQHNGEANIICILRHQNMGQQAGSGKSAVDRPARRRGLHNHVAAGAAHLGTHMADDLEAGWDILQHLGDIFASFDS
jgi:hypothetical protein